MVKTPMSNYFQVRDQEVLFFEFEFGKVIEFFEILVHGLLTMANHCNFFGFFARITSMVIDQRYSKFINWCTFFLTLQ